MEIKSCNFNSKKYPRKVDVSEEVVEKNMLNKWITIGLASVVVTGLLENISYGLEIAYTELSGDVIDVNTTVIPDDTNTIYSNTMLTNTLSTNSTYKVGNTTEYTSNMASEPAPASPEHRITVDPVISLGVVVIVLLVGLAFAVKKKMKKQNPPEDTPKE